MFFKKIFLNLTEEIYSISKWLATRGKKKPLDIVSAVLAHMAAIVRDTKVLSGCVFVGLFIFLGLIIKSAKSPLNDVDGEKACEETTFLSPDSRQKHKLRSNLETALGRVT